MTPAPRAPVRPLWPFPAQLPGPGLPPPVRQPAPSPVGVPEAPF